jgi:hypothetical protein
MISNKFHHQQKPVDLKLEMNLCRIPEKENKYRNSSPAFCLIESEAKRN